MRLSFTTDDISSDLNTALEVLLEQNCKEFELRGVGFDRLPAIDERWLAVAEKAVNFRRLRITSLATDFFLNAAPSADEIARLFEISKRLKSPLLSIHAPRTDAATPEENPDQDNDGEGIVLPPVDYLMAMRAFVAAALRENCQVMLRIHPDSHAATAPEALALIKAIGFDSKCVGLDWDVALCFGAGDDSGLDSLEDVLPVLKTVRVRDAVRKGVEAECVSMGKGVIPWEDIIEQLYEAGYRGPVTLEPGALPKLKEARAALTYVARWIDGCRTRR